MTTTDAIKLLRTYNKWRRGDESIEQPNPAEIGIAIDTVLNSIENAQQDHSQPQQPPTTPLCHPLQ